MGEPNTYLGASSRHLHCENYKFQPNTPMMIFKRDEICPGLKWVDISGSSGILDNTTFKNLPNLEIISFDKCNIENIQENTFLTLPNLQSINVRKSTFPLDDNTFKNCKNVDNLRFIQIENGISVPIFSSLKNLEYLMIDHTKLGLSQDTFHGLDNLKYLFIQNCTIHGFPEDIFKPLSNLETLYFTGNSLENIDSKAFLFLQNLKILGIQGNSATSSENLQIDYQAFENLSDLDTINFPEEVIRSLKFEKFKNLKNVQMVIENTREDIVDFLKQKNIDIQWTSDSDLTEDVDLRDPNIQICA